MMLHRHFEQGQPKNLTKSDFSGGKKPPEEPKKQPKEEKPKKRKKQE